MNIMISTGLHQRQQDVKKSLDKNEIVVKQSIRGRMRVRVRCLQNDRIFASWMRERLNDLQGIRSVETREITGSVIITYSASQIGPERILEEITEQVEFPVIYNCGEELLSEHKALTTSPTTVKTPALQHTALTQPTTSKLVKGVVLVGGTLLLGLLGFWKSSRNEAMQAAVPAPTSSGMNLQTVPQNLPNRTQSATIISAVLGGLKDALLPSRQLSAAPSSAHGPASLITRELAQMALRIVGIFSPFAAQLITFIRTGNEFMRAGTLLMAPPQAAEASAAPAISVRRCTGCSRNCLAGFAQCPRGLLL